MNVSIGGTLTHFAAPPVLMVARHWDWTTGFMLGHFGWRAVLAIVVSTLAYFLLFRREFSELAKRPMLPDVDEPEECAAGVRSPAGSGVADGGSHVRSWRGPS